jgi:hypothetical protein
MKSIKYFISINFLFLIANSISLVELFGLGSLLENMGKMNPVVQYDGTTSVAYTLDPNIFTFLKNFKTRT